MATRAQDALSAIVLAAGAGERMGGPKALLLIDGEPLARVHARRLREAGCDAVVVVTRAEIAHVFAGDARVAVSSAPDPAGSLAIGMRALSPSPDDVIVITPVDAWPAHTETIARLVAAVRDGAEAATPLRDARGGHPVVVRARVLWCGPSRAPRGLAVIDAPRPLRDVLADLGARRVRIEVSDDAIAVDLDTPDDVLVRTGAKPRFA